jgi:hypothetical protein
MAFEKGHPGYKKKGTKNKDPLQLEERAHLRGVDVFEIALDFASGNFKALGYENECYIMENAQGATKIGYTIPPELRFHAIKELMKYIYPQKKALEVSGGENALKIIIEDYSKK